MAAKANRTKGNTKPSSSANAFNLFLKYSGEQPTFSDLSNYSSLTDESSHEIFVAIKKCYKRDLVTKSKGLKDILELFTNSSSDEYAFLLKHWIKLFLNLSNDDDFQVREVTLSTFEQINKLVKSQLTPFLKQIVPHWLCLTGDPHGNVAKLASQAFSSTFGKNKLNDVFLFAKEPIIGNVHTILFKTNYNEKKNEIRLIPGAFYSVIVLSKIAKDDQFLNDELGKLLENEQFWKYSKFADNNVQCSWFNLINSLLSFKFDLVRGHLKKLGQATFSRLGEKNGSLQENIWRVLFTLMKLDEESCFNELNYDKVFKSFKDLLKRNSSFDPELLAANLHLLLKYFLLKNEDKQQFLSTTFDLFQAEIVAKKDLTLAINLFFQTLLFTIQNPELISSDREQTGAMLDQLINQRLSSTIDQLSSDSKCLQELFKKLVNFSANLKTLNCDQQVQLINELIFKSVRGKLNAGEEFDLQSIKGLLNTIFNLKAYQSKKKLSLFAPGAVQSFEFVKYKFEFYERTDDQPTKRELLKEILRIVFESTVRLSGDFIEFLNYLVQFAGYLEVLDESVVNSFIAYFKQINQQLSGSNDQSSDKRSLMIRLYYVIHQIHLKSTRPIDGELLDDPANVFSSIFALQLFTDDDRIDSITEGVLATYQVLFRRFESALTTKGPRKLLDQLDEEDHDELAAESAGNRSDDQLVQRLAALLHDDAELDLLNAIHSLLSLKLSNFTYAILFDDLMKLKQHDEVHIVNHLILHYLAKNNKVLPVSTIEPLIFGFIEFTNQRSLAPSSVWLDVLFQSLKASADRQESTAVVRSLSAKFKQLLLDTQNPLTFDQLNLIVPSIYTFVIRLSSLDEYSDAASLNGVIKSLLVDENEFEQLKGELNAKVFEFLWTKNDFAERDFPSAKSEEPLKIPHLANASYAMLKVSKLLRFTGDVSQLKGAFEDLTSDSTDEQISNLLQSDSSLEYLLSYSSLSYSYLKILNQIGSYGAAPANDLIEHYTAFYEQVFKKLDEQFVKAYANRTYRSKQEDTWSVTALHHLLSSVGAENVFDFDEISKTLKVNNFSLIMKFISKQNLELFLQEVIQYNLVSKVNHPDNFDDIKEYLNIIALCLTDYAITIDCEKNLLPIANSVMAYQEKIQAKEVDDQLYLRDRLDDAQLIASIVSVMNFLDQFIRRSVDDLSSKFTNFLFYSLLKWSEVLQLDESVLLGNQHLCSYLNQLFSLVNNVAFLMQLNISNLRSARSNWLENYSFKINERLFRFFVKLSALEISFVQYDMVNTLGKCLVELDNDSLVKMQLKDLEASGGGRASTKDEDDLISSRLSNNFSRLFNLLADLLMKRNSLFSLPAHHLIGNYLKLLANQLSEDQEFLSDLDEKLYLKPPNFLLELQNRINEELSADSGFNEYANSLKIVYFLIWKQLLDFWDYSQLNEQIKCTMANYLKDRGTIDDLFDHFNNILPIDRHLLAVYYKHGLTKSKIMAFFKKPVILESASLWSADTLYHLSCQIYLQIFKRMPTTMRLWINTATNQTEIKQFTSAFVSDIVIQDELRTILDKASNSLENLNLRLKIRQTTNEVMASYSFEDIKIELTLTLPTNYPIGLIKINAGDRVGVSLEKWRSWELQLTTFLAQNGSVFDGILVWINNIKKTLENHEECCICFFVLQSTNNQLPKVTCKSCRKKFHSICISKWFAKSGKRNCALCRNEM